MLPSQLPDLAFETWVACDTETSGLFADDGARVSTVSVAWRDPDTNELVGYAWPFDQGVYGKPEDRGQETIWPDAENLDLDEWAALLDWLSLRPLIFHNAKFDLEKLRVGCRRWPGIGLDLQGTTMWDTQNVTHLLWPLAGTTSLKPTSARLFGADVEDESKAVKEYLRKKKLPAGRWDLIPWDILGPYATQDALLTYRLYEYQVAGIDAGELGTWLENVYETIERRLQTTLVLYRMEWRGLPYDEVESRMAGDECVQRATAVASTLPFGPTGPKAKHFFFGDGKSDRGIECLNLPPYAVSDKTSEPSLTAEILERMVEDQVPYAERWLEWNKVDNAASMWYNGYADKMGQDGRLRCCFRQNGTVSSRFSVERVNLQAIPQDYRLNNYIALDGVPTPRDLIAGAVRKMKGKWKIYELDLAQAELRVAAMFAKCDPMLEMINEGQDLHAVTTRELFNLDIGHPDWGKYRQVGKRGNFSLIFGAKWLTFMRMVSKETGIRLKDYESQDIVAKWNRLYPEFGEAIERHSNAIASRQVKHGYGWIDLINGERRWFEQYEEAHKAFNQRVQANLAQFGVDWMLRTDEYLRNAGYSEESGTGLVLTIHDSQVLLLPDNWKGGKLAEACAEVGRELWKEWFPDVPGEVDYHKWG